MPVRHQRHTFSWAFVEPRADLVGDNGQLIKHTKGPTWTAAADGSSVSRDPSRVVKSVSAPLLTAISPGCLSLSHAPVPPMIPATC